MPLAGATLQREQRRCSMLAAKSDRAITIDLGKELPRAILVKNDRNGIGVTLAALYVCRDNACRIVNIQCRNTPLCPIISPGLKHLLRLGRFRNQAMSDGRNHENRIFEVH